MLFAFGAEDLRPLWDPAAPALAKLVVDLGSVVDMVHPSAPNPPTSPNPPRKCRTVPVAAHLGHHVPRAPPSGRRARHHSGSDAKSRSARDTLMCPEASGQSVH